MGFTGLYTDSFLLNELFSFSHMMLKNTIEFINFEGVKRLIDRLDEIVSDVGDYAGFGISRICR